MAQQGRPKSVPVGDARRAVFQLHADGLGLRRISHWLLDQGIRASPSSVDRLLKGLPPYGPCVHHWKIEPACGPESLGTCQKCGETKFHRNSIEPTAWATKKGQPNF